MAIEAARLQAIISVEGAGKASQDLRNFGAQIDKAGQSAQRSSGGFAAMDRMALNASQRANALGTSLQATAKGADAAGKGAQKASGFFGGFSKSMLDVNAASLAAGAGMAGVAVGVGVVGKAAIQAGIDFESAFAGVEKTVDGTDAQLAVLEAGIRDMATEIPIAATEIAGLAESAGALGIATEDIMEFTRVTALIGVTTDVSAGQAATSLGQLSNVLGLTGDDYETFANQLVALGNDGASTESAILGIAEGAGAASNLIGMASGETLAWASAVANLGINAEAGSTSLQTFYLRSAEFVATAGAELNTLAATAGMTAEAFQQAFAEDSGAALQSFIEGLGQLDQAQQIATLSALGFNDARITRTLLGLAANTDNLTNSYATMNKATEENNALMLESEKRFETTASKMALLENKAKDVAIGLFDAAESAGAVDIGLGLVSGKLDDIGEFGTTISDLAASFGTMNAHVEKLPEKLPDWLEERLGPGVSDDESWVPDGSGVIGFLSDWTTGVGLLGKAYEGTSRIVNKFNEDMLGAPTQEMKEQSEAAIEHRDALQEAGKGYTEFGNASEMGSQVVSRTTEQIRQDIGATGHAFTEFGNQSEMFAQGFGPTVESALIDAFTIDPAVGATFVDDIATMVGNGSLAMESGMRVMESMPGDILLPALADFKAQTEGQIVAALVSGEDTTALQTQLDVIDRMIADTAIGMREHTGAFTEFSTAGEEAMTRLNTAGQGFTEFSTAGEEAMFDVTMAAHGLQEAISGLSGAYSIGLDIQQKFTSQGSEYAGQLGTVEKAYEAVQAKVEKGIELTEDEILVLEHGAGAMDTFTAAQHDSEVQAGLAAIANAELIDAQWDLNEAVANNEEDLGPYLDRVKDAEQFARDMGVATDGNTGAQALFADALLKAVEKLGELVDAINGVPPDVSVNVIMNTAGALEAFNAFISGINNSTIHVNAEVAGIGFTQRAKGGTIPPGGEVAWVGEEGPELMFLPGGAEIVPHVESMAMAGNIPGYADGTGSAGLVSARHASMDVSGFMQVGLDIGEQILSGIITAFGPDALAGLMPAADAIADAMITGAVVKIESEIEGIPDTFAVNAERIPELAASIGQDTAMALMESYAELQGELQLAILSGEDTSQIDAELAAILALFEAWGISVLGTATTVAEAMQAVADADAFESMFTDVLGDLEGVASGERADDLKEEFNDLWAQLKIAQEKGMTDVVADLDAQMQAIEDELAVIGEVAGTAVGQGMIEAFNAEQIAAEWAARLGDAVSGPSFGSGLQADIDALQSQIDLGILTNAPSAVIAGWQKEKADLIAQSEQYWKDIATAGANGLLSEEQMAAYAEAGGEQFMAILEGMVGEDAAAAMTDGVTQMTDEAFNTLLDQFQEHNPGKEMIGSVVDGWLSGAIPFEQATALLADIPKEQLYPVIIDEGEAAWQAYQQALIDGSDPTVFKQNAQEIIDFLISIGMTAEQAANAVKNAGEEIERNWSSSGFGWISGPSGPVLPSGGGSSSLSSRSSGGSSSGGGGSTNWPDDSRVLDINVNMGGDDDIQALMEEYPGLDWAGILAGAYGPGGLNSGSSTEQWVAAGLRHPTSTVGEMQSVRVLQVLLDHGLDIANNKTLFERFEIAVQLVTENAELLQDSLFMGALGIIGISEEAIRAAQTATKLSKNERSTVSEPIRLGEDGDVFIGISDRWADDLGFVGGNTKEGSSAGRIPGFANGGMIDHPLLALMGEAGTEMVQPLSAGHPERAAFIADVAAEVARTMGGGPPTFVIDGQVFAGVTGKRVMHGVAAKAGS